MLKETMTNAGEPKRKSVLDKQCKLILTSIYSKKLSIFNLETQLNKIHKRKNANFTSNNNIVKNLLNKNTNSQSDFNSSGKYENKTTQKVATQPKKTEEGNKNGIKHS